MREFGKSRKLDNVLYDVRGPVVDEAARMEENGTNVLKLNIGNPAPFGCRTQMCIRDSLRMPSDACGRIWMDEVDKVKQVVFDKEHLLPDDLQPARDLLCPMCSREA